MAAVRQADESTREQGNTGKTLNRRGILAAAGAMVAGIVAKQAAQPVAAGVDNDVILGSTINNDTTTQTAIINKSATPSNPTLYVLRQPGVSSAFDTTLAAVVGNCGMDNGFGIVGLGPGGRGGAGVRGVGNTGVQGITNDIGTGVSGQSANGIGVSGTSTGGYGVSGDGTTGCYGNGTTFGLYGQGLTTGVAGIGLNPNSIGGVFTGPLAPLKLTPATSGTGAPTTGAHTAGELYVDSAGNLFYCKASGTPGTWLALGASGGMGTANAFMTLPTPERFVDTRSGLGGVQGPVPANTTHTFQMTGRAGQSGNAALIIPDAATTIVGNLTVVGAAGIPLGSFVTLWPGGAQPTVSNVNVGPGGVVANSYVVGLSAAGGHGTVSVYNQSAGDYILDLTGYYIGTASASVARKP